MASLLDYASVLWKTCGLYYVLYTYAIFGVLDVVVVEKVSSQSKSVDSRGFAVTPYSGPDMLALQCDAKRLPPKVRSLLYIHLVRYDDDGGGGSTPRVIASLSHDGVRIEDDMGLRDLFVSGNISPDLQASSLTLLILEVNVETEILYGCKISYLKQDASNDIIETKLNVTRSDLDSLTKILSKNRYYL